MAALYELPNKVSCIQAISWSPDNRIAFCTDTAIRILTIDCSVENVDSKVRCKQGSFPVQSEILNIPQFTDPQHKFLINHLSREDLKILATERVLNPFKYLYDTMAYTGYAQCEWSPLGADSVGRSILVTLSFDYRLCLHSQGSSKCDWLQICDLSVMRLDKTRPDLKLRTLEDYYHYKDWCLTQAVSVVKWFPSLLDPGTGHKYAVLAAGNKSGHIVIWRVNVPTQTESDCSILQEFQPYHCQVSSLEWDQDSGALVVGYQDGQIKLLQYNVDDFSTQPKMLSLFEDSDLMKVGSISVLTWKDDGTKVVLASKEHCMLAFNVCLDKCSLISQTFLFLQNVQPATGLCRITDNCVLMMSHDAMLQKVSISMGAEGVKLSAEEIDLMLPPETVWVSHGFCMSPNNMFTAFITRPHPGFDHLAALWKKTATKIHIRCIEDLNVTTGCYRNCLSALKNSQGSLGHNKLLDVTEIYRQCVVSDRSVSVEQNEQTALNSQLRNLQIKRFELYVRCGKLKIKQEDKKGIEELETQISNITTQIFAIHVKQSIEKNKSALSVLNPWIQQQTRKISNMQGTSQQSHDQDGRPGMDLEETNRYLAKFCNQKGVVADVKCCICSQNLTINEFTWQCSNGHTFELCCKTLQPIEGVDYTTCTVCFSHAKPPESLNDIKWLGRSLNRCTLCDGLMLVE